MADFKLLKEMGERIYHCRKSLKLTQEELAEKVGVSTQMISNLETGKKAIRPENLVKICKALNISTDYILTGSQSKHIADSIVDQLVHLPPKELQIVTSMIECIGEKTNGRKTNTK